MLKECVCNCRNIIKIYLPTLGCFAGEQIIYEKLCVSHFSLEHNLGIGESL